METLYRKVQFEINEKDHDEIWLIGKSADFTFNPNTKNGEELFDFLSCCEEVPETIKSDNTETLANALQQIEKLEADKAELLNHLQDEINEFSVLGYEPSQYQLGYNSAINDIMEILKPTPKI